MRRKYAISLALMLLCLTILPACGANKATGQLTHRGDVEVLSCTYDVPDGMEGNERDDSYKIEEDGKALYVDYFVSEDDAEIEFFDSFSPTVCEDFETQTVSEIYGNEVVADVTQFSSDEIDGLPAYRYDVKYTVDGNEITCTMVMVGADKIHSFSYEQVNTNEYSSSIEESIASIDFEYEEE